MSSNKVALVTGGASGLGADISKTLAHENIKVVVLDILPKPNDLPEQYYYFQCDLTKPEQVATTMEFVLQEVGRIDVLINNAGVIHNEPFINLFAKDRRHSLEGWQNVLDINLTAAFTLTSYVAEHMIMKRIKGTIINISSISAQGNAGQVAYSASKAGLEAMSNVWAKELGPLGIRSVAIAPGFIEVDSTKCAMPDEKLEDIKAQTPISKLGKISNISSTVLYVINNDFLTGTTIKVDGGLVI